MLALVLVLARRGYPHLQVQPVLQVLKQLALPDFLPRRVHPRSGHPLRHRELPALLMAP